MLLRVRLSEATAANRAQHSYMQVDRPHIDQVIAWKRGEAVFDDVPLSAAMAKMNRYSRTLIVLAADASVAGRRIRALSGQGTTWALRTHAVAALHGLVAHDGNDYFELHRDRGRPKNFSMRALSYRAAPVWWRGCLSLVWLDKTSRRRAKSRVRIGTHFWTPFIAYPPTRRIA